MKSYLYDEFGSDIGSWGSAYNTYRYTGQEYDASPLSGYNLRAREYYPKLGRFMQNDPIGDRGGSLNWYAYVANNPINETDIIGLTYLGDCWGAYVYAWNLYRLVRSGKMYDKKGHCLALCEVRKNCGRADAYLLSYGKEVFDWLGGITGIYPGGTYDPADIASNRLGTSCPPQQSCSEQCRMYSLTPNLIIYIPLPK